MANDGPQPAVPSFQVGYNYPWAADLYGQNFGPVFFPPDAAGLPTWKTTLPTRLDDLKALGVKIIRWFILMNGLTYGKLTADSQGVIQKIQAPTERFPGEHFIETLSDSSLFVPGSGWSFDPPDHLEPLFIDHFRQLLQILKSKGMQLIPSLVDFPFFAVPPERRLEPDLSRGLRPRNPNSGGGRADIMTDTTKRRQFFDTVFEPLLQASVPFQDQIYAWEVMNEPSWLVNTISPVDTDPKVKESDLKAFLREGVDRIQNHPEFAQKSTVGHRFFDDLSRFATGAIPQFHYYAKFFDNNPIPQATGNNFIGEIAVSTNELYFASVRSDQAAPWPELKGSDSSDAVFQRLSLLAKKGYKLVFLWPDEKGANDKLKLSAAAQQSLRKFTTGH